MNHDNDNAQDNDSQENDSQNSSVPAFSLTDEVVDILSPVVEALIFASDKPLSLDKIQECLEPDNLVSKNQLRGIIENIQSRYELSGIELKESAGLYRFQTKPDHGATIQRLWEEKPQKYSRALLETLALIAYRQPITRGDIEEVRGVAVSSNIMKTLIERGWVRVIGHREVPGRPSIYATTKEFLAHFNLNSLEDLPTLAEIRDIELIAKEVNAQLELNNLEEGADSASESEIESKSNDPSSSKTNDDHFGNSESHNESLIPPTTH